MATTNIDALNLSGKTIGSVALGSGTAADVTNGNSTRNDGRVRVLVNNTGASSDTVSVTRTVVVDGATLATHDFTVAAGAQVFIGPFDTEVFGPTVKYQATAVTTKFTPVQF